MRSATRRGFLLCGLPILFLPLAVLVTGIAASIPSSAEAQEAAVKRPWSLRNLFMPRKADRVEPGMEVAPKARKKPRSKVPRAPREPDVPVVEKLPDSRTVMVIGDFLGAGLAEGLDAAFAQNPRVRILDRTSGSSGFVRDDFHNWPETITELIDTEKPAVILVMLGANDRQQMRVDGGRETLRSDKWMAEYGARTQALAKAIAAKKVPFLWVGVPAFKYSKMLSDMLAFNDVYRAAAEGAGAEYIDIWDGFVDENGAYVSTGPDINGQPVRLRANDGINLTTPGKRKIAFYVEKPLSKLLGESTTPSVAALTPASLPKVAVPDIDIGTIDRTQPISLKDPELDGGTELLGSVAQPKRNARSPGERLVIEGVGPDASPGRADDFSWPRPLPPSSAAADKTTAITP